MAVTYRASATGTAAVSPVTVAKPSGLAEGDLLLLHVGTASDVVPNPPAGFELIPGAEISGASSIRIYQRIATAGEPDSYTVSWPSGTGNVALSAYMGNAIGAEVVATNTPANGTSKVWASVTASAASLLACFGTWATTAATTPDPAMIERYDQASISTRLYLMTQALAGAGATGTRTATTGSATNIHCVTIALVEGVAPPTPSEAIVSSQIVLAEYDAPAAAYISSQIVLAEYAALGLYASGFGVLIEYELPIELPILCGQTMPYDLAHRVSERSGYRFDPAQILGYNGRGLPVLDRHASLTWTWDWVTAAEWFYLTRTVLAGQRSQRCLGDTVLWNHDMQLRRYSQAVIHRPLAARFERGQHVDVTLRITQLLGETEP